MIPLWRIRQFSCVDADGRVVDIRPKKGIGNARVVAWRIRWDGPGFSGRSQSFTKSGYATPSDAFTHAEAFVEELRMADKHGWPADERGRPVRPTAEADRPAGEARTSEKTLKQLGEEWIDATGGQPKTVQGHERSLDFALAHLPDGILANDVTSAQATALLKARRYTPGVRARKLVRMGQLDPDDDRARMCSVKTERVFLQNLRAIFARGIGEKPQVVFGNPTDGLTARSASQEPVDPSNEITFSARQFLGIAALVDDVVFRALIILRGFTAIRTGEFADVSVDDVDTVRHVITATDTEGEAPSRLTPDGTSRTRNHLKQRAAGDKRPVDYPDAPLMDELMTELIAEARRRHDLRTRQLRDLLKRYRAETGKEHLVNATHKKLRAHLASPPRLITMPDGAPFAVSSFDRDIWKPALRQYFPIEDPRDDDYSPLRESRFYNLRAAAVGVWTEEGDMKESDAADMAGHSIQVQRTSYRKRTGEPRPRSHALDAAADSALVQAFGSDDDEHPRPAAASPRWEVRRCGVDGRPVIVASSPSRAEAEKVARSLEAQTGGEVHWSQPAGGASDEPA